MRQIQRLAVTLAVFFSLNDLVRSFKCAPQGPGNWTCPGALKDSPLQASEFGLNVTAFEAMDPTSELLGGVRDFNNLQLSNYQLTRDNRNGTYSVFVLGTDDSILQVLNHSVTSDDCDRFWTICPNGDLVAGVHSTFWFCGVRSYDHSYDYGKYIYALYVSSSHLPVSGSLNCTHARIQLIYDGQNISLPLSPSPTPHPSTVSSHSPSASLYSSTGSPYTFSGSPHSSSGSSHSSIPSVGDFVGIAFGSMTFIVIANYCFWRFRSWRQTRTALQEQLPAYTPRMSSTSVPASDNPVSAFQSSQRRDAAEALQDSVHFEGGISGLHGQQRSQQGLETADGLPSYDRAWDEPLPPPPAYTRNPTDESG